MKGISVPMLIVGMVLLLVLGIIGLYLYTNSSLAYTTTSTVPSSSGQHAPITPTNGNIIITASSVTAYGTNSIITLTVKDNTNSSVNIQSIILTGNESIAINNTALGIYQNVSLGNNLIALAKQYNVSTTANLSQGAIINDVVTSKQGQSILLNIATAKLLGKSVVNVSLMNYTFSINTSAVGTNTNYTALASNLRQQYNQQVQAKTQVQANVQSNSKYVAFSVGSDGSLSVQQNSTLSSGYTIQQGTSKSFIFNSHITTNNGRLVVSLIPALQYGIVASGSSGSTAQSNVIANP